MRSQVVRRSMAAAAQTGADRGIVGKKDIADTGMIESWELRGESKEFRYLSAAKQ